MMQHADISSLEEPTTALNDESDTNVGTFRSTLAAFSYSSSNGASTPLRRSPRKQTSALITPKKEDGTATSGLRTSTSSGKAKRKRATKTDDGEDTVKLELFSVDMGRSPSSRKLKTKRGYADPETYAHLNFLQDYIEKELDVLFCGINPGQMSAQKGHHFANPTNHFWRCLHQSGFTPTRLPPDEDFTLPEKYNLGLTNLVDRPSAEAAELSEKEQLASAPIFLAKCARARPRIVCYVGIGIGEKVIKALKAAGVDLSPKHPEQDAVTEEVLLPSRSKKKVVQTTCEVGLQRYKLVHPNDADFAVQETLFYVVPSTSGRVTGYQLPDKSRLFGQLKEFLAKIKVVSTVGEDLVTVPPAFYSQ